MSPVFVLTFLYKQYFLLLKSLEQMLNLKFLKFLLMNPKRNKQETV